MSQQSRPMFINLPPPSAAPDTPEMPGTPTSATTSISALSTIAIKDGQRGTLHHGQHAHQASTTSLEAERADRISRLAGLERVSTLRPSPATGHQPTASISPQTTPTSSGFQPQANNAPAVYFDAHGQPTAASKMSTVGTASATESDDTRTTMVDADDDDDLMSDANYREEAAESVVSNEALMDQDDEQSTTRSVGDRMSDDGNASLVGFGEGAGSTISGPIYQRRPIPGVAAGVGGPGSGGFGVERSASGLSDSVSTRGVYGGGDTPISISALQERRDARMVDGVTDGNAGVPQDEMFVDTTNRPGVPASQFPNYRPNAAGPSMTSREAAEHIVKDRLDHGESRGGVVLGSPSKAGGLGKFYFEDGKK